MTVDELREALAGLDGSTLVTVNTIGFNGLYPIADAVELCEAEILDDTYHCVVLAASSWPYPKEAEISVAAEKSASP